MEDVEGERAEFGAGESAERETGIGLGRILWTFLIVLLLYVLSTGPVIKMCVNRGGRVPPALDAFYKPLELSYNHIPIAKQFFDWYFKVWKIK